MTTNAKPEDDVNETSESIAFHRQKWLAEREAAELAAKFEREKWEAGLRQTKVDDEFREREIKVTELEAEKSRWASPLVLALTAAALAAIGNGYVAWLNGANQSSIEATRDSNARAMEESKAEYARVLEAVKLADPEKISANLELLIQTGLLANANRQAGVKAYLASWHATHIPRQVGAPASASGSSQTDRSCPATCLPVQPPHPVEIAPSFPPASAIAPSPVASSGSSQAGASFVVPYETGWLGGGHNQIDSCLTGRSVILQRYPGKTALLLSSREESKKDFFGRVEYNYFCTFQLN